MRSVLGAVVVVAALAACDSSTAPQQDPVEWNASVAGLAGYEAVEGAVAVTATTTSFEAAIELAGLAAGEYEWEVAAGTCEDPGSRVGAAGAYEQLTSDENGAASGSATVGAFLQSAAAYHVAVFTLQEEDEAEVRIDVACGDLERE